MLLPKISVIIINFNLGDYLEETILSVIRQNYPNLELIMIDGGSSDSSLEIIRKYEDHFHYWVSEPDAGQYDAVQKGFAQSSGEIMTWINSDDKYVDGALNAVGEIFNAFPKINWITGHPLEYNDEGAMINRISLPWARWSKYRYLTWDFQFIQQESTFWRRDLWERAGGFVDKDLKLAGDLELWSRFFRTDKLYTANLSFAGFRYRKTNQRSRDQMGQYLNECRQVIKRERKRKGMVGRLGLGFLRWMGFMPGIWFFYGVPFLRGIYPVLYRIPQVISFDHDRQKYVLKMDWVQHPPLYVMGRQVSTRGIQKPA